MSDQGNGVLESVRVGMKKAVEVGEMQNQGGKNSWQKDSGKKGSKRQENDGRGENSTCWTCGKTGHISAWCRKGGNKHLYAIDEDESENIEETLDSDEEFQAWCLLEQSENEQWQDAISRRDKEMMKQFHQASLLSVENSEKSSSKKIIEVKGRWVKVSVTMNSLELWVMSCLKECSHVSNTSA